MEYMRLGCIMQKMKGSQQTQGLQMEKGNKIFSNTYKSK